MGLAREVAALYDLPLKQPTIKLEETGDAIDSLAAVTILDPENCPRYTARMIVDLTVKPSPFWLRRRLLAAGVRAINNLVDVTNYVMLELGQPLHAFDYDQLRGGRIVVRRPQPGEETFVTLDGQNRQLTPDTLLICDAEVPVAIGGIMGGLASEVTPTTRRVLLESAYFNPPSIRRTAKRLGLQSESAYRFERGVDPEGVLVALDRAAQLMAELGGRPDSAGSDRCLSPAAGQPSGPLAAGAGQSGIGDRLGGGRSGQLPAAPAVAGGGNGPRRFYGADSLLPPGSHPGDRSD